MKPGYTGIKRIVHATRFSLQGLAASWRHESAFRQESVLTAILVPLGIWLGATGVERALLVASVLLIPIVELLNTGVETVVDRLGAGEHPLSGRAKDVGSAAVMLSLVLAAAVWGLVLWPQ
jgi:diacylglycerol kinase (ATP)